MPSWIFPTIAFCAIGAGCGDGGAATAPLSEPDAVRPNILLIVADDMGYTDLGSFGGEIRTPNLDALAYDGVRLTNFRVHPSCAPTRAALMSGTQPHIAGVGTQLVTISRYEGDPLVEKRRGKRGYEGHLSDRVASIPEILRQAGYRTYMTGKWHIGKSSTHSPAARGFDRSFDLMYGSGSHFPNAPVAFYREDGEPVDALPDAFYSTRFYTDRLIAYIEEGRASKAPWFGYLAYTSPHWPLQVPRDWLDRYEGEYDEGYDKVRLERIARSHAKGVISNRAREAPAAPFARPWADLGPEEREQYARKMEIYASMVENLDFHVGRFLDYLEATGQLDDTIIIFMSDNGAENFDMDFAERAPRKPDSVNNALENFGNPDSFILYGPGWAQAGMGPFSLHKGTLADGGIRAAAFVSHKSIVGKGETEDAFLTVRDLSATLLDIAGAEHPGGRDMACPDGESFLPLLTDTGSTMFRDDKLFFWEHDGQVALFRGVWKYRRLKSPHGPSGAPTGWQLFNLVEDPGETTDVGAEHPALVAEFSDAWADLASSGEMIVYPG